MTQQIYVASRYRRRLEMVEVARELTAMGYGITARWLLGDHEMEEDAGSTKERERFAVEDLDDVRRADILLTFTEPPREKTTSRGGMHVEFGVAVERSLDIYVVGHRQNVFHWLPEVRFFDTWQEARAALQERARLQGLAAPAPEAATA